MIVALSRRLYAKPLSGNVRTYPRGNQQITRRHIAAKPTFLSRTSIRGM
jgi:hypothetical protein